MKEKRPTTGKQGEIICWFDGAMSEQTFVEKPFLDQLAALNWQVIDQGTGVPSGPTKSLHNSFRGGKETEHDSRR